MGGPGGGGSWRVGPVAHRGGGAGLVGLMNGDAWSSQGLMNTTTCLISGSSLHPDLIFLTQWSQERKGALPS